MMLLHDAAPATLLCAALPSVALTSFFCCIQKKMPDFPMAAAVCYGLPRCGAHRGPLHLCWAAIDWNH
jgi:hypothetical protein